MDRLRIEVRLRTALDALGLPSSETITLMSLRAEDTGATSSDEQGGGGGGAAAAPRLDLGGGPGGGPAGVVPKHVVFANDLSKDRMYSPYGRSLMDLLHSFPGRCMLCMCGCSCACLCSLQHGQQLVSQIPIRQYAACCAASR